MQSKKLTSIIDSRHLKILSVKKDQLKDALVFVILDEEKYGSLDKSALKKLVKQIDSIESDGIYFPLTKKMNVKIYDIAEFKNRDILVTLEHENPDVDKKDVEDGFRKVLPEARDIRFVHRGAKIERA